MLGTAGDCWGLLVRGCLVGYGIVTVFFRGGIKGWIKGGGSSTRPTASKRCPGWIGY